VYHIRATCLAGSSVTTVVVDGIEQRVPVIPLADDRREHTVEVRVAPRRID
jgi:hypothetical protein